MRTKLSEKYQAEREAVCNKIIGILELDTAKVKLLKSLR